MSADHLREAARVLRERADAATPGPWVPWEQHGRDPSDEGWSQIGVKSDTRDVALTYPIGYDDDQHTPDAAYIATMHPGVGLVLADWLEYRASWHELQDGYGFESTPDTVAARRIADLILGGEES